MDIESFVTDESEQVEEGSTENTEVVTEVQGQEVKPDSETKPDSEAAEEKTADEAAEEKAAAEKAGETEEKEPETETKMVPLAALHEEREKNKALKEQIAGQQQQQQTDEPAKPEPGRQGLDPGDPDPYLAVDDDDFNLMMPAEVRTLELQREAWKEREYARNSQLIRQQQYSDMEVDARQRFDQKSMGQNLDYDSVTKTGAAWLKPEDSQAVLKSSDPAKKLYDLCLERCPYLSVVSVVTPTDDSQEKLDEHKPEPTPKNPADAPSLSKVFEEDDQLGSMADSFVNS